jgi:hypothetical protein
LAKKLWNPARYSNIFQCGTPEAGDLPMTADTASNRNKMQAFRFRCAPVQEDKFVPQTCEAAYRQLISLCEPLAPCQTQCRAETPAQQTW